MSESPTSSVLPFDVTLPEDESGRPRTWSHRSLEAEHAQVLEDDHGFDTALAEAMVLPDARPRINRFGSGLFVVLRGVNLTPGEEPDDMVSLRVYFDRQRIVSVSPRRVFAVEDVRRLCSDADTGPTDPPSVFAELCFSLYDRMVPVIDAADEEVDRLDEALDAGSFDSSVAGRLSDVRGRVTRLRRHLRPQRDAFVRLWRERIGDAVFDADQTVLLREVADRMQRVAEDLESIHERADVVRDRLEHETSGRLNRNMYVLSIVTALFLPASFVTGLLGINVGGMPGVENPWAFWVVAAFLAGLMVVGMVALRRLRMF